MRKSVWFAQLERALSREGMTGTEKRTVMNYYEEMYQDKHDDGLDEEEIIKEFGFPEDVAQNVRENERDTGKYAPRAEVGDSFKEYEADGYEIHPAKIYRPCPDENAQQTQNFMSAQNADNNSPRIGALSAVILIILDIVLYALGLAFTICGVALLVCGFFVISFSVGAWLAAFGMGLIMFAVGCLIFCSAIKVSKTIGGAKMKKFIIAMVAIIILGSVLTGVGCAVYFTGDNKFFSEEIAYAEHVYTAEQAFSGINLKLKESHAVTFKRGEEYSVKYFDSEKSPITVSVSNGTMTVDERGFDMHRWWERLKYKFRTTPIVITVPDEVVLSVSGAISGKSEITLPSWQFADINLMISGSADLKGADITCEEINIVCSGSSDIVLSGTLKQVNVAASGSTDLKLSGNAESIVCDVSGSADLSCDNIVCPDIRFDVSGSSDISLSGTGDTINIHASGSSDVYAKDFSVKNASFSASGSINAEISVSDRLFVKASGSATVYYYGNPQIEREVSGTSKIEQRG